MKIGRFVRNFGQDMDKKYVQKVIPSVSTERYRKMSAVELRKEALLIFNTKCKGTIVRNLHTGIPVKVVSGKKTAYGEAIYSKKVAVMTVLALLIEYACYSNWGARKEKDNKNVIGYYNFKAHVFIDKKKECVRLAVRAMADGAFYYNVEVNKKK